MRRPTYKSLLVEAIELEEGGAPKGFPVQSRTGKEHLCAHCGEEPGDVSDDEGRLLCLDCAQEKGIAPYGV